MAIVNGAEGDLQVKYAFWLLEKTIRHWVARGHHAVGGNQAR